MSRDFRCTACGHMETQVKDSRQSGAFKRRRRRVCKCGHRFSTVEIPEADYQLLNVDGGAIAALDKHAARLHEIISGIKQREKAL